MYTPEELEPLLTPLRQNANNEGYSGNLFSYFAQNVKKNMHIILITDVTHPNFVQNCESNPALYKVFDYFIYNSLLNIHSSEIKVLC